MALPKPNLDDKTFAQIVDDARALIPRVAPDWTDHNVHDPGITFIELFAWLAEIQQYRLNRVAEFTFLRFLRLAGIVPKALQPATVRVAVRLDSGTEAGVLVPAHSPVLPVGRETFPFETVRDTFLTASQLVAVRTTIGGREIDQTRANADPAAHFAPFGPSPSHGGSMRLGFDRWFAEPEIHLHVELYELGLPPRQSRQRDARGFVPSAGLHWEYLAANGWQTLSIIEDETLALSQSGRIRLATATNAGADEGIFWIRATLASGSYELAPNIAEVSTNAVTVRQVERIVNEDLGAGLGTPDQIVRLKKSPLLITEADESVAFEVGDVLDWQTLIIRLARPVEWHRPHEAPLIQRVADRLGAAAQQVLRTPELIDRTQSGFREPDDDEKRSMAEAFDALLDDDLYERRTFGAVRLPAPFDELAAGDGPGSASSRQRRRFNRALLLAVLPDQVVSERLVVQVGTPATHAEEEPKTWHTFEQRTDFSASGPADRHYVLNPETGEIRFGNGLNGLLPSPAERIRARLYFHSRGPEGNLGAGQAWRFADPRVSARGSNATAVSGGAGKELLEDATLRARGEFRARSRAITVDDYASLVRATPGLRVAQVEVLPQLNPRLPCATMPGHVTVVVLPYALDAAVRPPEPSVGFLATVANHLSGARLVTTALHVIGPSFVRVSVGCSVFLAKGARDRDARARVLHLLNTFLDPVRGGPAGDGWPFGRSVFPSEIHALLLRDPAVDFVVNVTLNERAVEKPLPLGPTALPVPGGHSLTVVTFEQRGNSESNRRESGVRGAHRHG